MIASVIILVFPIFLKFVFSIVRDNKCFESSGLAQQAQSYIKQL